MTACACCGAEVDEPGALDLDLGLPAGAAGAERLADGNVLLGEQAYVRCALPVELTGDLELWFDAWMRVTAAAARRAAEAWGDPSLRLTGTFAHDIKPWDDLHGAEVVAEVVEPGTPPELVEHPLLGTTWDRDRVLSAFPVALPISFQQEVRGPWSVERTAGLTPRLLPDGLRFAAPGRAVFVDTRKLQGMPADRFLEMALENAPDVPAGQRFLVRDGVELRHALWLTTHRHEFYGHVARFGELLLVTCLYDDPADHAWARHVLNSVRYEP
ncbi:hypothetical protein [Lentzea jiangxiensis]|uniref:DUF2199 domain-containing protein n=1 Tax=Lentzea jiangxiensis TaxID=641025 RepID=A0A1H0RW88_9PSEU|nr:hypothetical protein [Lentzea jiangxiensis]SDP33693.1 hypothetical protein SAMN05421507_107106 [Lentzea jiangxiensis]